MLAQLVHCMYQTKCALCCVVLLCYVKWWWEFVSRGIIFALWGHSPWWTECLQWLCTAWCSPSHTLSKIVNFLSLSLSHSSSPFPFHTMRHSHISYTCHAHTRNHMPYQTAHSFIHSFSVSLSLSFYIADETKMHSAT